MICITILLQYFTIFGIDRLFAFLDKPINVTKWSLMILITIFCELSRIDKLK